MVCAFWHDRGEKYNIHYFTLSNTSSNINLVNVIYITTE